MSRPAIRRVLCLLTALAAACLAGGATYGGERIKQPITHVLELFTSQGCSTCVPADQLLTRIAEEPGMLALSYHVDYWDYIGWRDTFGSPQNTERQRAYAKAFHESTIYTPELVINGRTGVVGSHEKKIRKMLPRTALDPAGGSSVGLSVEGDRLHIVAKTASAGSGGHGPVLMLVTFDDRSETEVDRGENRGHTLINTHSVRDWRIMGLVSGKPLEVDLPIATLTKRGNGSDGCAAIIQSVTPDGLPGPILAASLIEFDDE
ncbi:DUF1223 domain-containing protein [Aurantimonas sp. VKM B-3413]|uniref:DUF1223 domain-containing protein n=1 Tax=Aurantimonas sp. VKM B-3413 TaxID=2779401 RepID=UPI001E652B8F|nr:DUF1223 domain-containing protein [Aurantimonas sp. VKM B-3413]